MDDLWHATINSRGAMLSGDATAGEQRLRELKADLKLVGLPEREVAERGERIAREIESGSVFVNSLMRSDQRLPFGGIKKSGYGRELSELGIKEFMNAKTIYVK